MTIDTKVTEALPLRPARRAAAVSFGLLLGSVAAPALAAPPDGGPWEPTDNGSVLQNLLFLLGVPLLVFVVLALLVYLPSMVRRQSTAPELAFRDRAEWFGGPRKGVDATTDQGAGASTEKGGASARW